MSADEYRKQAILRAVENGWALTPLKGKAPVLKGWNKLPPETNPMQWAAGNVGLRTGLVSGIYVIDVDEGGDITPLDLPPTLQVRTGSGVGMHYYFHTTTPLPNTASKLGPKIDTRGDGGQVVYPGSIHPKTGKLYEWANDLPVAELPDSIIGRIVTRAQPVIDTVYARTALNGELDRMAGAAEGARNATLNRAAFSLGQLVAGGQLTETTVRGRLLEVAVRAGLPDAEARKTIASGLTAGLQQPRRPRGRPSTRANRPAKAPVPDDERPAILIPGAFVTDEGEYGEVGNHDFIAGVFASIPEDHLYSRGGILGELVGPPGGAEFHTVTAGRLRCIVDSCIRLIKWTKPISKNSLPEKAYTPCTQDLAELLLRSAPSFGGFRQLRMLVAYPVFYGADMTPAQPGWNADAGIYYDRPEALESLAPIRDEKEIHRILADAIVDFPFDSDASRQNYYGLLLTPMLRPSLRGNVPFHIIESTIERAGKSKLIEQVMGGAILGRSIPSIQYQDNEAERDKTIISLLLKGTTVINFDNLSGYIKSSSIASLITSNIYSGRVLGQSGIVEVENRFTMIGTGNKIKMSAEIAKRTVPIMLRPQIDHPELRSEFVHDDLPTYLSDARLSILGALLGMVENWRALGSIRLKERPLGGFEDWAAIVGGVLWSNGFIEWRRSDAEWQKEANTEVNDLETFIEAWIAAGGEPMTTQALFNISEAAEVFLYSRAGKSARSAETRFGILLSRYAGRPISGCVFRKIGMTWTLTRP